MFAVRDKAAGFASQKGGVLHASRHADTIWHFFVRQGYTQCSTCTIDPPHAKQLYQSPTGHKSMRVRAINKLLQKRPQRSRVPKTQQKLRHGSTKPRYSRQSTIHTQKMIPRFQPSCERHNRKSYRAKRRCSTKTKLQYSTPCCRPPVPSACLRRPRSTKQTMRPRALHLASHRQNLTAAVDASHAKQSFDSHGDTRSPCFSDRHHVLRTTIYYAGHPVV